MKYPLSFNQNKLFRYYKFYPNDPSYNLVFLYKMTGDIDLIRLKNAIEIACNSIDLLKVNFKENELGIFQNCMESRKYEVEIVHRDPQISADFFQTQVIEKTKSCLNTPIDLYSWPLLQFTLYFSNDQESYLTVSCPHIIADGFSYTHLIEKINRGYQKLTEWRQETVPYPCSSCMQKDLEFFQAELPSSLDSLELRAIKQERNAKGTLDGTIDQFEISKESIQSFLNQKKYSESSFFLAIHALFLKKLSDENRIVIGLPVLNRNKHNKDSFGYFVNTVPLVIDFNEIQAFQDLIEKINKKILRLLRHQSFDVGRLRNIDTNFTNYFTYYDREFSYSFDKCQTQRIYLKRNAIASEFIFTVEKKEKTYMFCIESGHFFQPMDVAKCLQTLIDYVVIENPSSLRKIPIIKDTFNSHSQGENHGCISIARKFEEMAQMVPNHIALNDFKTTLTYDELDKKSNRIARFLNQYAKDSKYILISPSRTNDLIVLILGILKAGKCYVPVDKFCPVERFRYICHQLGTPLIVGDSDVQTRYQISTSNFIAMDDLLSGSFSMSHFPLKLPIWGDDLAYIIYTSGTTGNPKGVQISQKNLLSLIQACFQKFSFTPQDVWTLFHSYSFDFSVWEIFGCLLSGGQLLIIDTQVTKTPTQFYSILSDYGVTVLNQTPTAFRELIRIDLIQPKPLGLRYIIFGGEALCFPNLKEWVDRHPINVTKLINMYGITETTIHVTYYEIQSEDLNHQHNIVGKPLANLGMHIVNSEGHLLPQGMVGEISIYGEGVSCGYYQAKELTEKKFIAKQGIAYYLSGDVGKINRNGDLVFLGRKDRQVQVRGFRVELDEIEFHILKTGLVQQCAIDAIHLENDSLLRIIAYFVPKENFNESVIKNKLTEFLPFYMIPAYFSCVENIPLTINGKVDFRSLKAQAKVTQSEKLGDTPIEKRLYQIISDTVKRKELSLDNNFWDLGVNSIDLAAIFFKIRTQLAVDLSMSDLFLFTTIKKLAVHIETLMKKSTKQQEKIA